MLHILEARETTQLPFNAVLLGTICFSSDPPEEMAHLAPY